MDPDLQISGGGGGGGGGPRITTVWSSSKYSVAPFWFQIKSLLLLPPFCFTLAKADYRIGPRK